MRKPIDLALTDWQKALTQKNTYVFAPRKGVSYTIAPMPSEPVRLGDKLIISQDIQFSLTYTRAATKSEIGSKAELITRQQKSLGKGYTTKEQAYLAAYGHCARNCRNWATPEPFATMQEYYRHEGLCVRIKAMDIMIETAERVIAILDVPLESEFLRAQKKQYEEQRAGFQKDLDAFVEILCERYPDHIHLFKPDSNTL